MVELQAQPMVFCYSLTGSLLHVGRFGYGFRNMPYAVEGFLILRVLWIYFEITDSLMDRVLSVRAY
jgi:hypothetical protein